MIEKSNYKPTNKRMYDYMRDANLDYLDSNALTYFQNRMKFREFLGKIDRSATSFRILDIDKGDFVPVISPDIPQGVISIYGLNKIGAIPDMLPVMASEEEFAHYLKEVPCKKIIVFRDMYPKLKPILRKAGIDKCIIISPLTYLDMSKMPKPELKDAFVNLKNELQTKSLFGKKTISWEDLLKLSENEKMVESASLSMDDVAMLSHTGGSTGVPKAAEMTNENFNAMVEEFKNINLDNFKRGDKILTILPLFINYGACSNIHMPLSLGIETIIHPTFDAKEAYDLFNMYKPNIFMCVADYFEKMLEDPRFNGMDLSFWKSAVYGGAPMNPEKKKLFDQFLHEHGAVNTYLFNGYGMTESCATILTERPSLDDGKIKLLRLPDIDIKTIDKDGKETKRGEAGELIASGPTMMKGYYNNPEETNNVFIVDETGTKWLRTGDSAIIHEDDSVTDITRIKRMLPCVDITNGAVCKVYPDNIENVISKSDYVEKAVVSCLEDKYRINIPMAFIKLKEGVSEEEALVDIKEKCLELNGYSRPYHFFFVDRIKYNKSEKVDLPYYKSLLTPEILNQYEEETYDQKGKKLAKKM